MSQKVGLFGTTPLVIHGAGAIRDINSVITQHSSGTVGVVTDQGIAKSGTLDKVLGIIESKTACFKDVIPEPPKELVGELSAFLKDNDCDLVISLGGGSTIDCAKMASAMVTNTGKVEDYFGVNKLPKPGIPHIAVPTTAGTGSEASPAAVFHDNSDDTKKGARSDYLYPRVAVLDPELTLTMPKGVTAATGVDALTHGVECYTSLKATFVGDMAAEKAIELIGDNIRAAYANGDDLEAREGMLYGSYLAGISLAIANVGVIHSLAQTIGGMFKVSHGLANALLLPHGMAYNRLSCREKYANIAELLGENIEGMSLEEASVTAIRSVRNLVSQLDIPSRLQDHGISEKDINVIADLCLKTQARLLALNPRKVDKEGLVSILKSAV